MNPKAVMSRAGGGSASSVSCAAVQGPMAPLHTRVVAMTGGGHNSSPRWSSSPCCSAEISSDITPLNPEDPALIQLLLHRLHPSSCGAFFNTPGHVPCRCHAVLEHGAPHHAELPSTLPKDPMPCLSMEQRQCWIPLLPRDLPPPLPLPSRHLRLQKIKPIAPLFVSYLIRA